MSSYYLASKYFDKYQNLVKETVGGGKTHKKHKKPRKKTSKEKRRRAEATRQRKEHSQSTILKKSPGTKKHFTDNVPEYWKQMNKERQSQRYTQTDPSLAEVGIPGRSFIPKIHKSYANKVWADTKRRKKGRSRHGRRVTLKESDVDYKQNTQECVRPIGGKPMWTDYLQAGANDGPSHKCPGTKEYPDHRYLHYLDGRYCCTDVPTNVLEACSFLQDRIEPEFENFSEKYTSKHREISQKWKPYCDYVLANPEIHQ
jgi:hypothetical protein